MDSPPIIRQLGLQPYEAVWQRMQQFTNERTTETEDEIWLVEHPPVFTLGQAGKPEHLLNPGDIPIVASDRGGQVTYHGPGQLIAYLLIDIKRAHLGVRQLVTLIEKSIIDLLKSYDISAEAKPEAPGVYVDHKKIAALGLRIRQGRSYHGLSLNVNMDLEPFSRINPCGYPGLVVTQLSDFGIEEGMEQVADKLIGHILGHLDYNHSKSGS